MISLSLSLSFWSVDAFRRALVSHQPTYRRSPSSTGARAALGRAAQTLSPSSCSLLNRAHHQRLRRTTTTTTTVPGARGGKRPQPQVRRRCSCRRHCCCRRCRHRRLGPPSVRERTGRDLFFLPSPTEARSPRRGCGPRPPATPAWLQGLLVKDLWLRRGSPKTLATWVGGRAGVSRIGGSATLWLVFPKSRSIPNLHEQMKGLNGNPFGGPTHATIRRGVKSTLPRHERRRGNARQAPGHVHCVRHAPWTRVPLESCIPT
jgi:hypothetical protein